MFRALSTRRSRRGYEQLGDDEDPSSSTSGSNLAPSYLTRAKSIPAKLLIPSSSSKSKRLTTAAKAPPEEIKKASKIHPFFSIFETKRKKKATAKPEFSRYLEYLKEGGMWDVKQNMPVIYYK